MCNHTGSSSSSSNEKKNQFYFSYSIYYRKFTNRSSRYNERQTNIYDNLLIFVLLYFIIKLLLPTILRICINKMFDL